MGYYNNECEFCGNYSNGYPLCYDCYIRSQNGEIFQDENGNWHDIYEIEENDEVDDYRKEYEAEFRAEDGHYVRSQGELLIDNWLYQHNIVHSYEKRITIDDEEYFPDFYIKEKKLYIEYFGITNDYNYEKKCKTKKEIYKNNGIDCIYIYPKNIKNLDDILHDYIISNKRNTSSIDDLPF